MDSNKDSTENLGALHGYGDSPLRKFRRWLRSARPDAVVMSFDAWQAIRRNVDKAASISGVASADGLAVLAESDVMNSYGWKEIGDGDWFRPESINSFEGTPVAVYEHKVEMNREIERVAPFGNVLAYEP